MLYAQWFNDCHRFPLSIVVRCKDDGPDGPDGPDGIFGSCFALDADVVRK